MLFEVRSQLRGGSRLRACLLDVLTAEAVLQLVFVLVKVTNTIAWHLDPFRLSATSSDDSM
jgi:hypothetical protein